VGDGPLENAYREILKKEGTESYVHFAGVIPTYELSTYYSSCDILLAPSQRYPSDGLNVVVTEAMACGRPVIASKVGGNDLVITPGYNGFLHDDNNPVQLADFIIQLIQDPGLARRMGDHSLELIRERFNWDAIAQAYLNEYQRCRSTGDAHG
jgi:glycosyltransferase involved in cell wall biosynthesis